MVSRNLSSKFLTTALLLILSILSTSASNLTVRDPSLPAKRTYDSHHYYAVELKRSSDDNGIDPRDVAEVLGVELVERVGELKDHWLVRSEKPLLESEGVDGDLQQRSRDQRLIYREVPQSEDEVLKRWNHLSQSSKSRSMSKRHLQASRSIHSIERQVLSKRHKRDKIFSPWDSPSHYPYPRAPLPGPEPQPYPFPEEVRRPPPIPDAISTKMMGQFDIRDPIFAEQWHLANDRIAGNDLNITGAWESGVKGKGVNVCLIDDGLDLHSPDLKENFVSLGKLAGQLWRGKKWDEKVAGRRGECA